MGNPQNERVYAPKKEKRDALASPGDLSAPQQQRGRGVMIHMAVSSFGGGCVRPHIIPAKQTATSRYYAESIPSAGVFPKIRARVMSGDGHCGRWTWIQDLDIPHTAKETQAFLKKEEVRTLPWMPNGGDFNPLD